MQSGKENGLLCRNDIILILLLLISSAVLFFGNSLYFTRSGNAALEIVVDGELFGRYALDRDQTIEIQGTNVCRIENGKVSMTEADCPDLICVHSMPIDRNGGSIVCLPNRVVLLIVNTEKDEDAPDILIG